MASAPISVLILTHNEEKNLSDCLESVSGWTREVLIVDSGSTDATLATAARYRTNVFHHPFETHSKQWQWALSHLPLRSPWILALDADQSVSAELREELIGRLSAEEGLHDVDAFFVRRRQIFRNRWIRHGGYYPKYLLKLFRKGRGVVDDRDLVDHHFRVLGRTERLRGDLIENNRNEGAISVWIEKHNRYARLQAQEECSTSREAAPLIRARFWGTPDERIYWLKRRWEKLPLFLRPFLYFGYRYVFRLGFLDGREGFVFHFLQAFWYRLLVDINIDEIRTGSCSGQSHFLVGGEGVSSSPQGLLAPRRVQARDS